MRILGIDPGVAIVGWGVLEAAGSRLRPVAYDAITTPSTDPIERRLLTIDQLLTGILKKYQPDAMAVEELFFNTNQTTGIMVAEARGVILTAATRLGIPTFEYTPLQVKMAVVGYGRAEKKQVISMVTTLLGLPKPPKPDDTADALAIAMCHAQTGTSRLSPYFNQPTSMKRKVR